MARKTDGEKLDELIPLVAVLQQRVDNLTKDVKDLKDDQDESRHKLWMIVPPLVAALFAVALTTLVNYLSSR